MGETSAETCDRDCVVPGAALWCQLCPVSPTYWRANGGTPRDAGAGGSVSNAGRPSPAVSEARSGSSLEGTTVGLDWSKHRVGAPEPCRVCGRPAVMRDDGGMPCHKVCAEQGGGPA